MMSFIETTGIGYEFTGQEFAQVVSKAAPRYPQTAAFQEYKPFMEDKIAQKFKILHLLSSRLIEFIYIVRYKR
jgi:hypothetical protein